MADALARAAEQGVDVEEVEELKRQLQQQSHLAAHLEAELIQRGAGGFDSSMHSLQMSLHRLTESRISDTKATVLESKLRGASGKHAALAEELHAVRTQVSELTLLQAQEVSARCEAEQLAELRKEEIEALVVEITDQCAEMSRLKVRPRCLPAPAANGKPRMSVCVHVCLGIGLHNCPYRSLYLCPMSMRVPAR